MYSLVLMAAMTGSPATANWCHRCHCGCHCGCYCGCWGCHGCCGCWGCYGCGCYGCYGGYCHGCWGCNGCYGCYGCYSCYGGSVYGAPIYVTPGATVVPKGEEQAPPPKKEKDKNKDEVQLNRARLIVQVPAGARLFIDEQQMKSTSERRTFVTPVLQPGRTYYYEVRAEIVRDGRTVSENQRVILRPGEIARASFANLGQAASATAQAADEQ